MTPLSPFVTMRVITLIQWIINSIVIISQTDVQLVKWIDF